MLDYGCADDKPSPDTVTAPILESLGSGLQTLGSLQNSISANIGQSLDTSASVLNAIADAITANISNSLSASNNLVGKCRSIIATQTYGLAGQALQSASGTVNNCCQCCNCTPQSIPGIQTIGYVPPYNPIPGEGGNPFGALELANPPLPECQPLLLAVQKDEPPKQAGRFCQWCNSKSGKSIVIAEKFDLLDIQVATGDFGIWEKKQCKDSNAGPWEDCTKKIEPQPEEPKENQPTAFYQTNATGGNVLIINLPETPPEKPKDVTPYLATPSPFNPKDVFGACEIDFYTGPANSTIIEDSAIVYKDVKQLFGSLLPWDVANAAAEKLLETTIQTNSIYSCHSNDVQQMQVFQAALKLLEHVTGMSNEQLLRRLEYDINRLCPTIMPTADQALRNYLSNAITSEADLKKYVLINGHCWEPFRQKIQSERSKYVPEELFALERRKELSASEVYDGMRQLGYLQHKQTDQLKKLQEFVPGPADIVRFMVRDTGDDSVVEYFHLDTRFEDKFHGDLEKWAQWLGIPKDTMKHFWRSHWVIPSPGQLFEMYQRLRYLPDGNPAKVNETDIRQALLHLDILPFWHDKFIAISFRPLSRIDVRRAFMVGAIDKDFVTKRFLEIGYSDENAAKLANMTERLKNIAIYNTPAIHQWKQELINRQGCEAKLNDYGYSRELIQATLDEIQLSFHNHSAIRRYKTGDLTYDEATNEMVAFGIDFAAVRDLLRGVIPNLRWSVTLRKFKSLQIGPGEASDGLLREGVSPEVTARIVDSVTADADASFFATCIAGLRKRYLAGEFTGLEITGELTKHGVSIEWATKMTDSWNCAKSALGKQIPASKLCDWFAKGIIEAGEFAKRLVTIGYSQDSAVQMVSDCADKLNDKAIKQAAAAAKKAAADAAKQESKSEADQAKQDAKNRRAAKQLEANRKAADKRNKAMIDIAAALAKSTKMELPAALSMVSDAYLRLRNDTGVSADAALIALNKAVDVVGPSSTGDYLSVAEYLAANEQVVFGDEPAAF